MVDLIDAHGPYAALFVTWAIPHLDRFGCLPDDPRKLRGIVLPLVDDVSNGQVGEWVEWLVERGMVRRLTGPTGERGIQFTSFQKHQGEARLDRERRSPFEPDGWLDDPSEKARRARAASMKNHRAKDADTQGTPGPLTDHAGVGQDHSDIREVKRREEKKPPYPLFDGRRTPGGGGNGVLSHDEAHALAERLVAEQVANQMRGAEDGE